MHQLAKTVVTDPRAALSLSDANETLPFEKETFDLVVSAHCVYFWDDLATSIREQARLIKPGGVLCIIMAEATKVSLVPFSFLTVSVMLLICVGVGSRHLQECRRRGHSGRTKIKWSGGAQQTHRR